MRKSLIFTAKSMLLACFAVLLLNFSLFAAADDGCHKHNGCGTSTSDLFNSDPFSEPSYAPAWSEAKVGGVNKVYGGQYLRFSVTKGNIYIWSTEGKEDETNGNYAAACSDSNQCGTDGKLQCLGGYCLYPFDTELTLLKDQSCNSSAELLAYSNTDGFRSQSALEWKATFDGTVTLLVTNYKYTKSSSGEESYVNCQPTTSEYTTTVKWQRSASEHCESCDAPADYKVDKTGISPTTAPNWTTVQSKSWIDLTNFSAEYNLTQKLADADANWIKPGSYIVFDVVEDQIYRWSTCVSEFYDTQLSLFKGTGTDGDCGQFLAYGDDSQVSYKYNNKDYCPAGTKQTVLEWQANFTGKVTLLFNEYNCYQCHKRTVAGNNWAHCFEVTETYKKGTNGEVEKDSEGFPVLADASTDAAEKITMTYMYAFPLDWQRYDCTSALCTSGNPKAKISDFGDAGWEEFSTTGGSQSLSAGEYMNFSLRRGSKYLFKSSKQNALITIKKGLNCDGKTLAQGVGQLAYFAETDPASAGADPNASADVITVFVSDAECQSGSNSLTYSFYSTSGADVSKRYTSQASGDAKIYTDNTTNLIFLDTNDWSPTWKQAMQKCEEFAVSTDAEVTPCPPTQCPPNHTPIDGNDKYCQYEGANSCAAPVCGYNYTEYPKVEGAGGTDHDYWGQCYYSGDSCDADTASIECVAKSGIPLKCPAGYDDWYSVTISNVLAVKPCCRCPSSDYTRKKQKVGLKYQYICVRDCSASQCVTIGGGCSDMAVESGCPSGYEKDNETDICYDPSSSNPVYTDPLVKYNANIDTTNQDPQIQGQNGSSTACPLGTTLDSGGTMCQIDNCGTWTFRNAEVSANNGGNKYILTDKDKCYKTEADAISGSGDTVPCCCNSSITIRGFTNSANNVTLLYDSTHTVRYKSGTTSAPLECSEPETVLCAEGWTYINGQCYKCPEGKVLYQRGTSTNWSCRGDCENYMTTTDNPPEEKCVSCNNSDEKPVMRLVEEGSVVKEVWECIKCPGDRAPILDDNQYTCLNTACNEDDFIKDGYCYPSAGDEGTQCKEGWVKDPQDEDRCRKVNTGQPYVECANSAAVLKDNNMSGSSYDGETFLTCDINKPNSVDCDCFYDRCETGYTDADKRVCPATFTYKGVTYNIDPVYDANGFITACKFTDVDGNICGESIGGWTLPNINQLYSLIDFDLYDPATAVPFTGGFYIRPESTVASCAPDPNDPNDHFGDKACGSDGHYICMDGKCVRNNWYWSSTTVVSENASSGEFVWSVNMQDGRSYRAVKGCTTTAECESDSGLNARAHKVMCVKGSSFSGIFDADAPSTDQTFSGWACNKSNDQVPLAIYFEITDSSATRKNIVSLLGDSDFISDIPGISKKGIKYESYDGSTLTAATDIQPAFGTALYEEIYNNCGPNSINAPHAFKVKWTEGSETTGKTNVSALIRSIKTKECSDEIIDAVYNGGSPDTSECAVPPYFVTAYAVDPTEAALAAVAIAPTERPFVIVNRCGDNYQTNDGTYTENCEKESFSNVCSYGHTACQLCAREEMTVTNALGETVTVKACQLYDAVPPSCRDGKIQSQYCYSATTGTICSEGDTDCVIIGGHEGAGLPCSYFDFITDGQPASSEDCDCVGEGYYLYNEDGSYSCNSFYNDKICPDYYTGTGSDHCFFCNLSCKKERVDKPTCGDGTIQRANCSGYDNCQTVAGADEECDDKNRINTDSCTNECKLARCGDGYIQIDLGEQCDSGDKNGYYAVDCEGTAACPGCAGWNCGIGGTDKLGPRCGDGKVQNPALCTANTTTLVANGYTDQADFFEKNGFHAHDGLTDVQDCQQKLAHAAEVCDEGENNGTALTFDDFLNDNSWNMENCATTVDGELQPVNELHANYAECIYRYKDYINNHKRCASDCSAFTSPYCGDGIQQADFGVNSEKCDEGLPPITVVDGQYYVGEKDNYNGKGYFHCKLDCSKKYDCGDNITETSDCPLTDGVCQTVGEIKNGSTVLYVKGPYPDSAVGEGCDAGTMNGTYGSCDDQCKAVAKCGNGNKKFPTELGDCIEKVPGSSTCQRWENCDFGTDNQQKHNTSVSEAWSAEQYGSCIAEVGCDAGIDQWNGKVCCEWGRYCGDGSVDNGNGIGSVTGVDGEATTQGWRMPDLWTLKDEAGEPSETVSISDDGKDLALKITLGSDGYVFAELGIDLPVKNERWFIEYDMMVAKQGEEAVSVSGGVNQYEDGGTTPLTGDYNNASPYYVVEKDAVNYNSGEWKHSRTGVIHGFASGATNAWFTGTDFVRIIFKLTGAQNTSFYIKALKFSSIESGGVQAGGGSANEMCDPGKDNFKTESSYYMTDCQAGCKWINYCGDSIIQRSDCTGFEGCTVVSGGEEVCDNGTNAANVYGGCEPGCISFGPRCGDSVVDRTSCASYEGSSICNIPDGMLAKDNEACDLGNNNADTPLSWQVVDANDYTKGRPVENTACRTNCNVPRCGDGVLDTVTIFDVNKNAYVQVEECDCGAPGSYNSATAGQIATDSKGNTYEDICVIKDSAGNITEFYNTFSAVKSPACRPNCKVSRCGDGIKDEGEACDDGNFDNNDTCKNDCTFATCDDGVFAYNRSYLCEELEGKNGIGLKAMADKGVIDCEDQAACTALLNGEETATLNLIESWFEAGYLHCCYNPKINGGTDDHNCEIPDGSGFKAPKKVAVDNCVAYSKKHTGGDSYSARTEAQCDEDVDPLFEKPFSDMFERCEQCVDADCGCAELFTEGSAKYIECIDNNRYCGGTCWNRIGKCGDGRIDNGSGLTIDAGEKCDNLTANTTGSFNELDGNSITVSDKKGIGRYCTGECRGTCTSTSYMCGDIDPSTNAAVTDNCWTEGCTVNNHGGDNSAATSRCGDGIVDIYAGEECDEKEGGDYTTNWCGPNCRWNTTPGVDGHSRCGDEVVQGTSGEKCDDGTLDSDDDEIDNDYCVKDCTIYYGYCGDGNITGAGYSLDTLYTYECTRDGGCEHGPEDCDLKKNNDNTYSGDARSVSLAETGLLVDIKICNECEKLGTCGNGERNPRFEGCDCWTASNASEESCDETLQSGEISVETKCSKTCTAEPVGQVEKWLPSKISGWACDPDHPMTHQAVTKDDGGTETGGMVRVEFFNSLNTAMTDPDYTKLVTTDEDVTAEIKNNVTVICGGGSAHGWEISPSTLGLDKAKGPYTIRVYAIALDTGEEDKLIGMKEGFITAMSCGDGVVSRCSDIEVIMANGSSQTWWNGGTCLDADVEGNCSDYGLTPGEPCVDEACDRIAGVAFGSDGDCYDSGDNKCQWTSCGDGIWQAVSTRAEECDGTDPNNGTVSCNGKAAEGGNPAIPAPVVVDVEGGTISGEVICNTTACKWNKSSCSILSSCPALTTAITDSTGHVVWNDFNYKTEKIGQYVKYTGDVTEYTRTWDSVANDWPDPETALKPNVAGVTAQCKFDCAENLKWDNEGAGENSKCIPKTGLVYECGPCPADKANGHGVWWSSAAEDKNCQTNNPVKTIEKTVSINDDGDVVISPASAVIEFNKDADDSTKCVWKCDNDSVYRQSDGKCYPKADPYHCKTLSTGVPEGMPTNATTFPEGSAYAWIKVTKDASNHIVLGARSASLDIPRTLDETFGDTGGDFYTPKVAKLGALSLNDATDHLVDIDTETESLCFWTCSEGYHWSNNYNKCIANSAETLCGNGQIDSEHCDTVSDTGTCIFTIGADEKCDSGTDNGKYKPNGAPSNCDKYCGNYEKCKEDNPDDFATKCAFINTSGYTGRIASTSTKPQGEYYCGDGYVQVPSHNDSYFTKCNDAGLTCKLVTEENYPGSLLDANEKCDNSANKIALCNLANNRTTAPDPDNTTTGGYYDTDNVSCKSDCSTILRPGDACGYCGDGAFQASESCEFVNGGVSFGPNLDGEALCNSAKKDQVQDASSDGGFGSGTIYSGSIEEWTVPQTGIYEIEVHGAKGGNGYYINSGSYTTYDGCKGAKVTAQYKLTKGQKLRLLAGKRGGFRNSYSGTRYIAGGGGGGSFVVLCNDGTCSTPTPLVIAGGGGGAYPDDISNAICKEGYAGNNGTSWTGGGSTITSGGKNGNDGGNSTESKGGLGWNSHKSAFTGATPSTSEFYGLTIGDDYPHGGFGGGGYGVFVASEGCSNYYYAYAGGGGGYSGGAAGFDTYDYDYRAGGGGGGSYYDEDSSRFITGSNSWTSGGATTTDGMIRISMVKYPGCNASSCTIDASTFVACSSRLAKCIYPDNAELWDPSQDTITQTWNSSTSKWEPNNENVYSATSTTTPCAFKCKSGLYTDGVCGDTRTIECTGKPDHSHWNIVSQISQKWNTGQNKWLPDETAVYGDETTTECHYACDTGYTYDSVNKTCINERTVNCTWPSSIVSTGASWNTVSSITQHWDLNHCVSENDCWYPRQDGVYNATASTTECRIACDFNYDWDDNSTCVAKTQTVPCTGLPGNAEWLEGYSTILQTWNGSDFGPATTGNWKGSGAVNCIYQCAANYHRVGNTNACESNTRTSNCGSVPEGAYPNTATSIAQTWTVTDGDRWSNVGDKWTPSLTPVYSTDPSADVCQFKCGDGYSAINSNTGCQYCGDNSKNGPEGCDKGSSNSNAWAASEAARNCKTDCSGWAPYCGDGHTDSGNETCDSGSANSNSWAVAKHCKTDCQGWAPYCGDGTTNGSEQCDSAYAAKCLDDYKYWESTLGKNYKNDSGSTNIYEGTIQTYPINDTGIYEITAIGARGGDGYKGTGTSNLVQQGCLGAKATAQFKLEKGQRLKILAGKPGGKHPVNRRNVSGAGGGGSFVVLCTGSADSTCTIPLVIAGGGGGGSGYSASNSCTTGQITENGGSCSNASYCKEGGTNGGDGTGTGNSNSDGGKGWSSHKAAFTGTQSELNGTIGNGNDDPHGGWGGGGRERYKLGDNGYSGGGGGYSGGGAASNGWGGGGGGSYISSNYGVQFANKTVATASDYTSDNTLNQGKVTIKFIKYKRCDSSCNWMEAWKDCGTKTAQCEGLPENAHWTTDTTVDQTWSNNAWNPTNLGCLDGDSGCSNACKFACDDGYVHENGQCVQNITCPSGQHYEGGSCVSNTRTGKACDSKPSNPAPTSWWGTGLVDQTWTDGTWTPTTTAFCSNTSTGATDCSYKCEGYFHCKEDQSGCEPNKIPQNCDAKPANSVWNDGHTGDNVGRYEQTWSNGSWSAAPATEYSETEGDCHWKCASNYHHDNGACKPNIRSLGSICTEQKKCYNASAEITCPTSESADFFGQDAYYAAKTNPRTCEPQSFSISGTTSEKIVVDNNTGLEWTQTVWEIDTFNNAKNKCSDLNYAGYDDWRMPEPKDLLTIVDSSRKEPPVDTEYFPNVTTAVYSIQKGTSSSFHYLTTYGFMVVSASYSLDSTNNYNVICVRGETLPEGSFTTSTVNSKEVVTDSSTGLMWQKTYSSAMNWQNALKYCETGDGSTYAGYTDWRMPNRNELATLLNFNKTASPYTDFPGFTNQTLWTSTTAVNNSANAIAVDFKNLTVTYYQSKTAASVPRVLCVRNAE